jgi:hypothetical protein
VPSGKDAVVITGAVALESITMESAFVSLPAALLALTVKLKVFATVGVPVMAPFAARLKPVGKLPLSMLHVAAVPVAVSVWLYANSIAPLGSETVVISGATGVVSLPPLSQARIANANTSVSASIPPNKHLLFIVFLP